MGKLTIEECLNDTCPWSGKPVQEDSLTRYKGQVVGFCNTGCRDKFDKAVGVFEGLLQSATGKANGE
ncbi:MAG: glutathione S-transferase [bacterium]